MDEQRTGAEDELVLDLCGLDPPEPLARILAALEANTAQTLRVRMNREPWPLYAMLRAAGWRHETRALEAGGYEIVIRRR
ncbi:MAG: DUF2249 domain-containing protein [Burkholderiales bacterium]|nr:DUF2249 domain-containing protein [Burkholderiales bacterium]